MRSWSTAAWIVALVTLCAAWTFTTPAFSAPDEWSHYARALGLGQGHLVGAPVDKYQDPELSDLQRAWVTQTARRVTIPPFLSVPAAYSCNTFQPEVSAGCTLEAAPSSAEPTQVVAANGTYQPAPYLVSGWAMAAWGRTPVQAILLGRLLVALQSLLLLILAALTLKPKGTSSLALVGLWWACTPMVLFIGSMLNPSGAEITGALAVCAGLLRIRRGDGTSGGWPALIIGGFVLSVSRPIGPIWLGLLGAGWVLWVGPGAVFGLVRARPKLAGLAAVVLSIGVALNRAWESIYGPVVSIERTRTGDAVLEAIPRLPTWIAQQVGVFQWLDTPLPDWVVVGWCMAVLTLVSLAFGLGTWRDRLALLALGVAALGMPVFMQAVLLGPIGWSVQGRHVLPISSAWSLFAVEIIYSARARIPSRALTWGTVIAFALGAVGHAAGILVNGHRSAVGMQGTWLFWAGRRAEWSPPLGWIPWVLAVVVVLIGLVLSSIERRAQGAPNGRAE